MSTLKSRILMTTRSITFVLLILASIALFATSVYRAATYPLTHDECLTFFSFTSDAGWRSTANNHILNTYSMQVTYKLFGHSELSLRLPNILAHALYLTSALLILKRLQTIVAVIGFVLLNMNLFANDFFFLARGYGLAMAFQLLSLFFLIKTYESKQEQRGYLKFAYLSGTFGVVAMFGNYAFVIHYIALVIANAWILIGDPKLIRIDRTKLLSTTIFVVISVACVGFVYWKSSQLQKDNQLYFGGSTGFFEDTLTSLVNCSCYFVPFSSDVLNAIAMTIMGICIVITMISVTMTICKREMPFGMVCCAMLLIAIVLPIIAHRFVGALFPIERGALYYLPLFALAVVFAVNELRRGLILILPSIFTMLLSLHFLLSFDSNTCYSWAYDKHNKDVLKQLEGSPQRVQLIHFKSMGPSLEYYQRTRGYDWLELMPVLPKNESDWIGYLKQDVSQVEYIYRFDSDLVYDTESHFKRVATFQNPRMVLLFVNP